MTISDVMLHVDEALDNQRRAHLEDTLLANEGVLGATFSQHAPHLMMVVYDADRTHGADLLQPLMSQGVHAEVVNML